MNINLINIKGTEIAEVTGDEILLRNTQDAVDLIGNCGNQGAEGVILHEHNIVPEFFDLETNIAGDILERFSTYRMKLAIVGDFSKYTSHSLKDFIYESNKAGWISFVATINDAGTALIK
jgi:hypothetical protein